MTPLPHSASVSVSALLTLESRSNALCPSSHVHIFGNGTSLEMFKMSAPTRMRSEIWHRYRAQMNAVRKLNQYPHRKREIRNLVPYFVCSGDEDLIKRYTNAIRQFPIDLPINYEEEKSDEAYLNALREKMTLFSEQADPTHFKTEPTPDGKHIKIWNDPPSLKQEKYRIQQERNTQLNEFAGVLVRAQKALNDNTVGDQLSIEDAVAKAKQWTVAGILDNDDAEAFEQKQQAGAILGAAFVAARHSDGMQIKGLLEWCQDVFDRETSAKRKPSAWSSRGTLLSMDPLVFATHGYAALIARGHQVRHCQDALLTLALDPLRSRSKRCLRRCGILRIGAPKILLALARTYDRAMHCS